MALRVFLYDRLAGWVGDIQSLRLHSCGVSWSGLRWLLDNVSTKMGEQQQKFLFYSPVLEVFLYLFKLGQQHLPPSAACCISFVTLLLIQNQITDLASEAYLSHGQLLTILITAHTSHDHCETSDFYSVMHYYGSCIRFYSCTWIFITIIKPWKMCAFYKKAGRHLSSLSKEVFKKLGFPPANTII